MTVIFFPSLPRDGGVERAIKVYRGHSQRYDAETIYTGNEYRANISSVVLVLIIQPRGGGVDEKECTDVYD
jgi:hypothetical protein